MHVRGPNNVGRSVQTDLTFLWYVLAITEQKNVMSGWLQSLTGFKLCAVLGVTGQQCCVRLRGLKI